jgi:hypothetical protein
VTWPAFLQTARVRAVEETDAEGKVWDAELRRSVTREAGQGITNRDDFLQRRATLLAGKGSYGFLAPLLKLPGVPPWAAALGWIGAFVIGWCLAAVGQESEINLLALPLIILLAWNAVMVVLSLWPGQHKTEPHEEGWREALLKRFERKERAGEKPDSQAVRVVARFRELVWDLALQRFAFRFRAWLHIGAALLALGSISAMYARGWSKEYRAVWESTLLDETGATKFFGALFAPASAVTGQAIPLAELPGMRRHASEAAKVPGDALPWIHLYAATLGLFVLVPRVLLTLLELSRARAVPGRALQGSDWQAYAQRLRSLVEGAGSAALVLTHGLTPDATAQDRWRHWAYLHWRDVGQVAFEKVPPGAEREFADAWSPAATRVMLVFNMAATPEPEVQRTLVDSLVGKLKGVKGTGPSLLLALDDADLRRRWAGFGDLPARLAERASVWNEVMRGSGAVWHEVVMPAKERAI